MPGDGLDLGIRASGLGQFLGRRVAPAVLHQAIPDALAGADHQLIDRPRGREMMFLAIPLISAQRVFRPSRRISAAITGG